MNRSKKIIRNIVILIILLFLFLNRTGLYLSPISAHEHSERSIHYGPSKVVHVEDFDEGKYILGKYDRWVSCNTINRVLFFFWGFGGDTIGFENDKTKTLDYSWSGSDKYYKIYGIINNDEVKKIEVTFHSGKVLTQTEFYDNLFLVTSKGTDTTNDYAKEIKGYDINGDVVFQDDIP